MTLGLAERQGRLFDEVVRFCEAELAPTSVYALLHRERDRLFPDQFFADLFSAHGQHRGHPDQRGLRRSRGNVFQHRGPHQHRGH